MSPSLASTWTGWSDEHRSVCSRKLKRRKILWQEVREGENFIEASIHHAKQRQRGVTLRMEKLLLQCTEHPSSPTLISWAWHLTVRPWENSGKLPDLSIPREKGHGADWLKAAGPAASARLLNHSGNPKRGDPRGGDLSLPTAGSTIYWSRSTRCCRVV